jgi:hypothetical protein
VNGDSVYWGNAGSAQDGGGGLYRNLDGTLMQVPIGGGTISTLAVGQSSPMGIAFDRANIYWTNDSVPTSHGIYSGGAVMRLSIDGGFPTTLQTFGGVAKPYGIAVDDENVYFTLQAGAVMKAPLDGGEAITLANSRPAPTGLALDSQNVYWEDIGGVFAVPIGGGLVTPLSSGFVNGSDGGQFNSWFLTIDGSSAYWAGEANSGPSAVFKVALGGGTTTTVASFPDAPFGIAVYGNEIYWTTIGTGHGATGAIMKASINGGAVTTLASQQQVPTAIAVDAKNVYWINSGDGDGTVMQMPK